MTALADVPLRASDRLAERLGDLVGRDEQLARALLVSVVYAVPALLCAYAACVSDPDVWWHLRSGRWMLEQHTIPRTDPFSSFGAGKAWAAYSWLYELLLVRMFDKLGLVGIVVYTTGMVLAITVALHQLVKRLYADFNAGVLLTFVAALSMGRLDTPRPWHFTILFFVLEMDILMQARRTGRVRELLWLPVIFALWANVHIQFVDGLAVLGVAGGEAVCGRLWPAARTRLKAPWALGVLGACVVATLANPYGWRIYGVAYELAAQPGVMKHIGELQAIPFRGVPDWCVLVLALGGVGTLARARRVSWFEAAVLALAIFLAFRSQRDVWLVAVAGSAVIASGAGRRAAEARMVVVSRISRLLPAFTGAVTLTMLLAGFRLMHLDNERLGVQLAKDLPVKAMGFVRAGEFPGALFNDYGWGGYLMWGLRRPVSIDGRAALQGDERIDRFDATWAAEPSWREDRELAAAGVVIGRVKAPLVQVLRLDRRFRLAYEDEVAAVFVPRERAGEGTHGTVLPFGPLPPLMSQNIQRRGVRLVSKVHLCSGASMGCLDPAIAVAGDRGRMSRHRRGV